MCGINMINKNEFVVESIGFFFHSDVIKIDSGSIKY